MNEEIRKLVNLHIAEALGNRTFEARTQKVDTDQIGLVEALIQIPGHNIDICRKRQYKNSLREIEHQNKPNTSKAENFQRQAQGARLAGNLQAAIIQLQEHSHVQQN